MEAVFETFEGTEEEALAYAIGLNVDRDLFPINPYHRLKLFGGSSI